MNLLYMMAGIVIGIFLFPTLAQIGLLIADRVVRRRMDRRVDLSIRQTSIGEPGLIPSAEIVMNELRMKNDNQSK